MIIKEKAVKYKNRLTQKILIGVLILFNNPIIAQTITGVLNIDTSNQEKLIGEFSGFNANTINPYKGYADYGSGNVYSPVVNKIQEELHPQIYRFPQGGEASSYNRYYKGRGSVVANVPADDYGYNLFSDTTYFKYLYANYNCFDTINGKHIGRNIEDNTINTNARFNIIFPFINSITHNRTQTADVDFVLNITNHYRQFANFDIHSTNPLYPNRTPNIALNTRQELFSRYLDIQQINNFQEFRNANFSIAFKNIVYQNIDAIFTLLSNKVKVPYIEFGNEVGPCGADEDVVGKPNCCVCINANNEQYECECTPPTNTVSPTFAQFLSDSQQYDRKLFYYKKTNCNTNFGGVVVYNNPESNLITQGYAGLCRMYRNLIIDTLSKLILNNTYPSWGLTTSDLNIKFGAPTANEFQGKDWNTFLYGVADIVGIDAFVRHEYINGYSPLLNYTGADTTTQNLNAEFKDMVAITTAFKNDFKSTNLQTYYNTIPANKEIWITEWNMRADNAFQSKTHNTLLHAMSYWDFIMSFIDINTNTNLGVSFTRKNLIKYATLWGFIGGDNVNYDVCGIVKDNNVLHFSKSSTYLMHQNLLPILLKDDNLLYLKSTNGGFAISNALSSCDLRSFYRKATDTTSCTAGSIYIYFNNKDSIDYTIDLDSATATLENKKVLTGKYNYLWGNQLYTSYGKTSFNKDTTIYNGQNGTTKDAQKTIQIDTSVFYCLGGIKNYYTCRDTIGSLKNVLIKKYSVGYIELKLLKASCRDSVISGIHSLISNIENIETYPNPNTTDRQNIVFKALEHGSGIVELVDVSGKVFHCSDIEYKRGQNQYTINISTLPKGAYILRLLSNNSSYSKMIIVQ